MTRVDLNPRKTARLVMYIPLQIAWVRGQSLDQEEGQEVKTGLCAKKTAILVMDIPLQVA